MRARASRGRSRAVAGAVLLGLLGLVAVAGPGITRWRPADVDVAAFRRPPSATHPLGTTPTGRDMYAITVSGLRRSLLVGLLVAVLSTGVAAVTGVVAGYAGGWADRAVRWPADLLLILPPFLVAGVLAVAAPGVTTLIAALTAFMWVISARVVRGMTLSLRDREYVLAARHLGVPVVATIGRHILPELAGVLIADVTLNVGTAIIGETSLSYAGLGVRPPDVSLGTLLADGATGATAFPWLFLPPACLIALTVFAVNLLGDGLRELLDGGGS